MTRYSRKSDGRPSWQFYPSDWLEEAGLRLCDLSARGLWIDLLCYMFKMEERGKLVLNGLNLGSKDVAKLVGRPEAEVKQALEQLVSYGVCESDDTGCIYSRRQVREEKQRRSKAEAGRRGGKASKPPSKSEAKGPASSSSSSSSPTPSLRKKEKKEKKEKSEEHTPAPPKAQVKKSTRLKVTQEKDPAKSVFGEHQNVFLTLVEYQKLEKELGGKLELQCWIEKLSATIVNQHRKPYKDHYATWSSWGKSWWFREGQRLFLSTLSDEERVLRSMAPPPTEDELNYRLGGQHGA